MPDERLIIHFDEQKIDAIFRDLDQSFGPGAAVGIAIQGKPVYRKGFGLASVELPIVLSPSMRMRIGSTTKHFTAFTYMRLCEQGNAGIDDPLSKYLPELHPVMHPVTMRQLMGNISGLREVNDIVLQFSTQRAVRVSTADLLGLYRDIDDVNAPPGTTWIYSNGNWVLLSVVIERITGKSLEDAMRELVFEPVGMRDTLVRRWDCVMVPNSASTHMRNASGAYERVEYCGGIDYAGAGAMVSTIDDMLRWMSNMTTHEVGTAATWKAMTTPHVLPNGGSTGYGLGLSIGSHRGVEIVHHAGGGYASNGQMLKVPAAGLDVVVLLNSMDSYGTNRVHQILDACLPNLEPALASKTVETGGVLAEGIFRSPKTGRLIRLSCGHSGIAPGSVRQLCLVNGMEFPFAPDREGILRPIGAVAHRRHSIKLSGDAARPAALLFESYGDVDELVRVPSADKPDLRGITGRYRWGKTDTEILICDTNEGPRLLATGRFGSSAFSLECLALDVWQANTLNATLPPSALIAFNADGSEFLFTNSLNRNLAFRRVDR